MKYAKEKPPYYWFLLMLLMLTVITVLVLYFNWDTIQQQLQHPPE